MDHQEDTLSLEFKRAAYRLVRGSPADRDLRYRDQLFEALLSVSANIAEGFGRRTTGDFCLFLTYARGSLAESMTRLEDGVERGHFTASACQDAIILGRRTGAAIAALQKSLRPFLNSGGRRGGRTAHHQLGRWESPALGVPVAIGRNFPADQRAHGIGRHLHERRAHRGQLRLAEPTDSAVVEATDRDVLGR